MNPTLTGKSILKKHKKYKSWNAPMYSEEDAINALFEMAAIAFEAGDNYRSEQHALSLGIANSDNEPNKSEFLSSLFPNKEVNKQDFKKKWADEMRQSTEE